MADFNLELFPIEGGYFRGDFDDLVGKHCSIQDWARREEPLLLLGASIDRMNLSREMAFVIGCLLFRFHKQGSLKGLSSEEQLANIHAAFAEASEIDDVVLQLYKLFDRMYQAVMAAGMTLVGMESLDPAMPHCIESLNQADELADEMQRIFSLLLSEEEMGKVEQERMEKEGEHNG